VAGTKHEHAGTTGAAQNAGAPRDPGTDWAERAAGDDWFTPGRFAALLGLAILAAFSPVLAGSHSFYFRDFGFFGYPLAYYHKESLWRGEFPWWNPFNCFGLPFAAQWNTLVFYPGSLIYLLLPLPWSLSLFCLAHLFLAGMGMYFLAFRWTQHRFAAALAGLAFALSGLMLSSLKWPNNIAVLGWMPWVVLLVEQAWREGGRRVLWAALAGAAQMLAGTPELILLTWFLLLALWLGQWALAVAPRWRMAGRLAAVIALVSGLSAIQLLPFLELLAHSHRGGRFGADSWAMPLWGWANFLVPLFHCFKSHQGVFAQYGQYWVSSYYVSVLVLGLALWAVWRAGRRRVWLLSAAAMLSLALALGEAGRLYAWLAQVFPPLGLMRFPIKFVVLPVFIFPLLAALGVKHWTAAPRSEDCRRLRDWLLVVVLMLVAMGGLVWVARLWPLPNDDWPATCKNAAWRGGCWVVAAALWWACSMTPRVPRRWLLKLALLALVAADALTHAPWQNPTVPRWAMAPGLSELQPRPELGQSRAMITPAAEHQLDHWAPPDPLQDYLASRLGLFCNCNLLDRIPKVDGFYSLYLRESALVVGMLYRTTNSYYPRLMDFLGVSQMPVEGRTVVWSARTNGLPWLTGGQRPVFASEAETLRALSSPDFDPRGVVYLPLLLQGRLAATNASAVTVHSPRWSVHQVEFEADTQRPALVVVAQAYHADWRASINGRPAPVWRANLAFQALEVPAGRSRVRFSFVDRHAYAGAALSLASLLVCGLAWRRTSRQRPCS
jgi:hypothetical protein